MDRRTFLAAGAAGFLAAPWARAQDSIVRIVVPYAPGGSGDMLPRLVAPGTSELIGRSVIVENRPGAGGSVGEAYVARARPDGLTLGIASVSTHGIYPAVMRNPPYDALKDFRPVTNLARLPLVMAINPQVPARNLDELIKLARDPKSQLSYGTPGIGSVGHMMGEMFKQLTGASIVHVPYRGAALAMQDTVAGQVQVLFDNLPSSLQQIKAGKLRAIAVSWPAPVPQLPDTPTFAQAGFEPLNGASWFGLVAPAGTPMPEVRRFQQAVATVLSREAIRSQIEGLGGMPLGNTPEEFADEIHREYTKWKAVADAANISLSA